MCRYLPLSLIVLILCLAAAGCGKKGPLYVPDEPAATVAPDRK
jgi:predicted small lipoprotein YifL